MDLFDYQHSVKKKQAEEIINQLIAEVDLADTESKKLKDVYKAVKAGNILQVMHAPCILIEIILHIIIVFVYLYRMEGS